MAERRRLDRQHFFRDEVVAHTRLAFLNAAAEVVPDFWASMFSAVRSSTDPDGAIAAWAERHHLGVDWVRSCAADRVLRPHLPPTSVLPRRPWVEPEDREIPSITWDPPSESEASFDERVKVYKEARRKSARDSGGVNVLDDAEVLARNLKWLARWQVLGESFSDIARAEQASGDKREVPKLVTIITEAVHRLHKVLGLPQRVPGKRLDVPTSSSPC